MATVIDELIVRLGLDPREFQKGQKEAANAFLKTRDTAKKTGKEIEDTAKKTGASIERMTRNIIAMFASIAGAKGLTELVTGLTKANAEIGRFAANVGLAPQTVAAWGAAVQRVGGDAGNAQQSISKLSSTITNFRNGLGQMPQEFWFLRQRSGVDIDPLAGTEEVITGIAEAVKKLSSTDRQSAFNFAQALGIDEKSFEIMRKYGSEVKQHIQSLEKLAPSNRAIEQAQKLQEAWAKLVQTIGKVVQDLLERVSPHLEKIVTSITAMVERLTKDVDWKAIDQGMAQFAGAVKGASENMDGLTIAVGAFFALWTGAQFAKVLANMLLLRGGGVAAGGATGGGAMASLTRSLPWLAALGVLIANKSEIKKANEDSIAWTEGYNRSKDLVERGSPGPSTRGGRKHGIGTMGGMRYTSGLEPVLHPSVLKDNMSPSKKDTQSAASGDRGSRSEPSIKDVLSNWINGVSPPEQGTRVDGRPVSKGNPMPVVLAGGGVREKGFFEKIGDAVSSFFGGDAQASTIPTSTGGRDGNSDVDDSGIPNGDPSKAVGGSAKRLMDRLVAKHGWTPAAAAISAGNAWAESGFRPGVMGDPQVPGGSWGLYQWNRSRLAKLKKFAASRKANWKDFDTQVDFHAEEANQMLPHWKKQTDLALADRIGKQYEGYAGPVQGRRSQQAARYLRGYTPSDAESTRDVKFRSNEARAWPGQDTGGIGDLLGAKGSALAGSISNDNRRSSNSSNVDTRIGNVNVYTQATDSKSIADRLWDDLYSRIGQGSSAAAANTGPV